MIEVVPKPGDEAEFFEEGRYAITGNYVSNINNRYGRSNLTATTCHRNVWSGWHEFSSKKDLDFYTGFIFSPENEVFFEKILMNPDGPYKKLLDISKDVQVVTYKGVKVALKLPELWFKHSEKLDGETRKALLYAWLIDSRMGHEYHSVIKTFANIWDKMSNPAAAYYTSISLDFSDDGLVSVTGKLWDGCHKSLRSQGFNYLKYRSGEPHPANYMSCSQLWSSQVGRATKIFHWDMYTTDVKSGFSYKKVLKGELSSILKEYEVFLERYYP